MSFFKKLEDKRESRKKIKQLTVGVSSIDVDDGRSQPRSTLKTKTSNKGMEMGKYDKRNISDANLWNAEYIKMSCDDRVEFQDGMLLTLQIGRSRKLPDVLFKIAY